MSWEQQQELQRLEEKINGVTVAVEQGFADIRKDIYYLGRFDVPLTVGVFLAIALGISALVIALDARALMLSSLQNQNEVEHVQVR